MTFKAGGGPGAISAPPFQNASYGPENNSKILLFNSFILSYLIDPSLPDVNMEEIGHAKPSHPTGKNLREGGYYRENRSCDGDRPTEVHVHVGIRIFWLKEPILGPFLKNANKIELGKNQDIMLN